MKRIVELICLLVFCMTLTGCAMAGDPNANVEVVDPNGEPVIVIEEECSKKEERFDANGNHVGYVQYSEGTNCGVKGTVALKYLDLDGNVLKTFSPQYAGCVLDCSSKEAESSEITYINEMDAKYTTICIKELIPYTCGQLRACIYYENGRSVCAEMYDNSGVQTARIEASSADKEVYLQTSNTLYSLIMEGYIEDGTQYVEREWVFDKNGKLMCGLKLALLKDAGFWGAKYTAIEVTNNKGEIVKTYERTSEENFLQLIMYEEGVPWDGVPLSIYEWDPEFECVWVERYEPVSDVVLSGEYGN